MRYAQFVGNEYGFGVSKRQTSSQNISFNKVIQIIIKVQLTTIPNSFPSPIMKKGDVFESTKLS